MCDSKAIGLLSFIRDEIGYCLQNNGDSMVLAAFSSALARIKLKIESTKAEDQPDRAKICGPYIPIERNVEANEEYDLFDSIYSIITSRSAADNDADPTCIRMLVIAAILQGLGCLVSGEQNKQLKALNDLDRATIVGRPFGKLLHWINYMVEHIENKWPLPIPILNEQANTCVEPVNLPNLLCPIEHYFAANMDIFKFQQMIQDANESCPFIIKNSISCWPALNERNWANFEYLRQAVGHHRLVPVEIGYNYIQQDWTQRLMPFGEFLDSVIYPADNGEVRNKPPGYLAQHDLFSQAFRLRRDYWLPDYTQVDTGRRQVVADDDVSTNIWLGPRNTVSPLHYDKYDNLFAQVVGFKYFKLFSPNYTEEVYPHQKDSNLSTTSQVNVDAPDHQQFPQFAQAKYVECIVKPGDLLYIPVGS
ncbi:hypothetical protein GGI25_004065 [Coemansia spiralis]|uniref:JmjC domain-containing protein n=1 Tax=Coemansia spiralis TaxID=417178 RepID=A0A9W8G115_9FUNG|nr:hypothetical protein GGI26_004643 [Coemansia sp. RSA 1358]KAJ2675225.1 hypothetical protein GGI25_004065 [Coemansia spiralis]